MSLNIGEWKTFQVGRLFTMMNGKGITQEEISDNKGDFVAVQSGEENNGVMGYIDLNYCKEMKYTYSEKPCLTVARTGTAGFVSFQSKGCVVGDSAKILLLPDEIASTEVYLFLQSVLTENRFKYTYGRKVTEEKYLNDYLVLPAQKAESGFILDEECRYSDEGYVPDWQFMEDYIKSLHHKPLTTKNKKGQALELKVNEWKEFIVGKIFQTSTTSLSIKDELERGNIPLISRTSMHNGCDGYFDVSKEKITKGHCITVGAEGIYAFYQPENFATGNKVYTLRNEHLTKYNALFITTILNTEIYKYSYGRARILSKLDNEIIKLPALLKDDKTYEPDWEFMENYIKSLPYGDRI